MQWVQHICTIIYLDHKQQSLNLKLNRSTGEENSYSTWQNRIAIPAWWVRLIWNWKIDLWSKGKKKKGKVIFRWSVSIMSCLKLQILHSWEKIHNRSHCSSLQKADFRISFLSILRSPKFGYLLQVSWKIYWIILFSEWTVK